MAIRGKTVIYPGRASQVLTLKVSLSTPSHHKAKAENGHIYSELLEYDPREIV